jgi:hypothetical protein
MITETPEFKTTFDRFCNEICDGLYDPKFPLESQSSGYRELVKMIRDGIGPASLEEMRRWEETPTPEELLSSPHRKYMRFLHPKLRTYVVENWESIIKIIMSDVKFVDIK